MRFILTAPAALGLLCCGALAGPAAAQSSARGAAAAKHAPFVAPTGSHVVTVVARDFTLELPDTISAGLTTFHLLNRGKYGHHVTVVRLDAGKTPKDAVAALLAAGPGVRPAWMHPVGGPNGIMPGADADATLDLEPGTYLAFCEMPGPDPAPHFVKGMVKGFTVVGPARRAALPKPDLTITMGDYAWAFSRPLTRGHHVIEVRNVGPQKHMLVIVRYREGYGEKDFLDWAYSPQQGRPMPVEHFGGVTTIEPGDSVVFDASFPPGRYGLFCFTPDAKDGKPHFMHGMRKALTVQ